MPDDRPQDSSDTAAAAVGSQSPDWAERRVRIPRRVVAQMGMEEIQKLVFEFQMYQVELEIQIEELRRAQHQLAKSRHQLADLYEFAPVGYLILRNDSTIQQANLASVEMLDSPRYALIGKRLDGLVAPVGRAVFWRCFEQAFAHDSTQVMQVPISLPRSPQKQVRIDCRRIDRCYCRAVMTDITARKVPEA